MRLRPVGPSTFVAAWVALSLACAAPAAAAPAGTVHYPDLQTIIPTSAFGVVTTASGKEFRYTHQVFSAGPGPLAVQPAYQQSSANYIGQQLLYTHDASGTWSQVGTRRVPDPFIFHAAH